VQRGEGATVPWVGVMGEGGAFGVGFGLSPPWGGQPWLRGPRQAGTPWSDVWLVSAHFRVLDGEGQVAVFEGQTGVGGAPARRSSLAQLVSLARMYSHLLRTHGAPPATDDLPLHPTEAPPPTSPRLNPSPSPCPWSPRELLQ